MKVSVIIPCFNEVDTVQLLLDSVNEDTSCEKEIIVIDDFSTDGSRTVLKENEGKKLSKLVLNESNKGKGYCVKFVNRNIV